MARPCTLKGMRKLSSIHTFEDRAFLTWVARASLVTLGLGTAAVVAVGILLAARGASALDPEFTEAFAASGFHGLPLVWWLGCVALATVLALPAHELVHAALFKAFAPRGSRVTFGANWQAGMLFACARGIVYTRRQYLAIVLAPTVAFTIAALALGIALGHPVAGLAVAVLHLTGCTGDWGYVRAMARDPKITHCEDTEWGVQWYGDDQAEGSVRR